MCIFSDGVVLGSDGVVLLVLDYRQMLSARMPEACTRHLSLEGNARAQLRPAADKSKHCFERPTRDGRSLPCMV
jgi:hypothetical protein